MAVERVAGDVEADVLRQHHGELVARDRDDAARRTVDDRDRRAPVTLAADAPVAQTIDGGALAPAVALGTVDHLALGVLDVHPVEEVRVHQRAGAGVRLRPVERGRVLCPVGDDAADRQAVFGRELEVAAVVRGDAEHRAGPVFHEHEIGDVDRQLTRAERVDGAHPGVEAELFLGLQLGRGGAALLAPRDELGGGGVFRRQRLRDRVVGGDRDERRAEDRVGAGGEDL